MERAYKVCAEEKITPYTVDLVHYLYYVMETLKEKLGDRAFRTWSEAAGSFVESVVRSYCGTMESVCKSKRRFLPSPAPPLLLASRSKSSR